MRKTYFHSVPIPTDLSILLTEKYHKRIYIILFYNYLAIFNLHFHDERGFENYLTSSHNLL